MAGLLAGLALLLSISAGAGMYLLYVIVVDYTYGSIQLL